MSTIHSIENDSIYLEVSSLGAEWKKLFAFERERSCLWSGKKEVWGRQAPILFPVIGKLKEGKYFWGERAFSLSPHGFARDSEFAISQKSANQITCSLKASAETLKQYPFDFTLKIEYSLFRNILVSSYTITNLEKDHDLPFSIGAHAAFSYDWLSKDKSWRDITISFEKAEDDFLLLDNNGLLNTSLKSKTRLEDRQIRLSENLFAEDALIATPILSRWVEISAGDSRKIRVSFDDTRAFGLWSKKVDDFICLEPWWGLPDTVEHNQDFKVKAGLMWLKPGASRTISWKTEFINVDKV